MAAKKRVVDAKQSTDTKFNHWKSRFKSASVAFEMGKLDEARTTAFRSLYEAEALDDRKFAVPACNLGIAIISMQQDKLKEAKEYFDKGFAALGSSSDPPSRELYAAGLRFLAIWHERQGDLGEAERCLRESIQILKDLGTDGAVQLANSLADLAYILVCTGHIDQAEPIIESAVEILAATLGREDAAYDWAKMIYQVCLNQGDEDLLAESLELSAATLMYKVGPRYPNLVRAMNIYVKTLKDKGLSDRLDSTREKFGAVFK